MKIIVLAGLVSFGLISSAQAGLVTDQSQLSENTTMAVFSQPDLAQSFQQSFNNIKGARVKLRGGVGGAGADGDITISLYDALPNAGGSLLATGTDSGIGEGQWATVIFGSAISVVPDTSLFLVFTSSNLSLGLAGDVNNPYSRGQVYANLGYQPFPGFDYTFETLADDSTAIVPEPSTFALLGIGGLALVGYGVRRKRQQAA